MNTAGKGMQMNGYIAVPFQVVLGTSILSRNLRGPNRGGYVTGFRLFRGKWGVLTSQRKGITDSRGGNTHELRNRKSVS
jgi:hypothetical protein